MIHIKNRVGTPSAPTISHLLKDVGLRMGS